MPYPARILSLILFIGIALWLLPQIVRAQSLPTFSITTTTPTNNAVAVPVNVWIQSVQFDYSISNAGKCLAKSSTFNQATVILSSPTDIQNYAFYYVSSNDTTRTFSVGSQQEGFELKPLTAYSLTIKGGVNGIVISCGTATYYLDHDTTINFTTDADKIPPKILAGTVMAASTSTGAVITWKTSQNATSQVAYGLTNGYGQSSDLDSTLELTHSIALQNLTPGATYHFQVQSRDTAGNLGTSTDMNFTALTIANISVSNIQGHTAAVSWTTNLPTDSLVQYGQTFQYGSQAGSLGNSTQHTVNLANLDSNQNYHFRVKATTADGVSYSLDNQFTTTNVLGSSVSVPGSSQSADDSGLNLINDGSNSASAATQLSNNPSVLGASTAAQLANWPSGTTNGPVVKAASTSLPKLAGSGWVWLWIPVILLLGLAGLVGLLWQHHRRLEKRISQVGV